MEELTRDELIQVVTRLSKFKKENKELLTYLLFESSHEASSVNEIKELMDEEFTKINTSFYFYIKKKYT